MKPYILRLDELGMGDVERVGGKNASLGEMISNLENLGVTVPGGFATTADAYRDFLAQDELADRIQKSLDGLDVDDVDKLAETGHQIRTWIRQTPLQPRLHEELTRAWESMAGRGPLVGHRGGSPRGIFRRPAGNLSERQRAG